MSNLNASENLISQAKAASTLHTVASFRSEYGRADAFRIEVESFCGKAGIPAINELRYAGHHLLEALDDTGSVAHHDHLHSAVNHSRRAAYEAYETGILTALEMINKFKTDFASIVVSSVVPNYADILQKASAAQSAVEEGRSKDFARDGDHDGRMQAFRDLRGLCQKLEVCRDEANKLLLNQAVDVRRTAKTDLYGKLTLFAAIITIIVTVLFGVPPFADWVGKHEWSPKFLKAVEPDNKKYQQK